MDGLTLLRRAQDAGLRLEVADTSLKISGPRKAEPLVRLLAQHKAQVLDALRKVQEVQEVGPSYRVANPEGLAEWKARHDRSGKRAPARLKNKFTWETLGKLKVPTLLMTGDADLWIPPFLLREVGARIPNSRVVIVADAGHALQWEQPATFNAAVLDFIGNSGRARTPS